MFLWLTCNMYNGLTFFSRRDVIVVFLAEHGLIFSTYFGKYFFEEKSYCYCLFTYVTLQCNPVSMGKYRPRAVCDFVQWKTRIFHTNCLWRHNHATSIHIIICPRSFANPLPIVPPLTTFLFKKDLSHFQSNFILQQCSHNFNHHTSYSNEKIEEQ